MATTDDVIRVRIEVGDMTAGLARAQRGIMSLETLGRAVGASIGGALQGAFALAAGVAGVGLVSRGIIGLQGEVKNAEIGIASLVSALTGKDIASSLRIAREQVKGLKEDAAKGAGELANYTEGFQKILGPARAAGASLKEVRELNKQALAAGFALRGVEGLLLAPMDVVQALTAGVGERTTPIVNQLLGAIGMTNEAFNKLAKRDRFEALQKAFATMNAGANLMGQTFDAQMATFKDAVKDIIRNVTEPVFDVWTKQLKAANEWMEKNRDAMKEMAENYGPKIASLWQKVTPGGAASAGAGAIGIAGAARGAGAVGGLGAIGGALGAGTGAAAVAAGGIAIAAALALVGAAFLAVKGGLAEFPELLGSLGAAASIMGVALGKLMDAFGTLTDPGSALNKVGKMITVVFVVAVEIMARWIMVAAAGIKFLGTGLQKLGLFAQIAGNPLDFSGNEKRFRQIKELGVLQRADLARDLKAAFAPISVTKIRRNTEGEGEDGGLPTGETNINIAKVEINIKTRTMDDPNRVAIAFDKFLTNVNQYKLQTSTAPLGPKPT